MKAILEFNLPEDELAHIRAVKATDVYLVIFEMYQKLRAVWKYSEDEAAAEAAEHWRDILSEVCHGYNINIDTELE